MQVKTLLKHNTVCVDDEAGVVVKTVRTPFKSLTQAWCAHEAGCLQALAELGFANAPRLISSTCDSFTMEQIEGRSLASATIDEDVFLRLMDVIDQFHGLGFAHGNLRPNNILLRGGTEPFLIDFETCCRRPNWFFLPTRLGDQVRLYLIWQSRVPQSDPKRVRARFPGFLPPIMWVIGPLSRFSEAVASAKRRLKRSLRSSVEQRDG
ncbi:MAG: hypothetical protein MUF08_11815 [Burkholderiaceae bacterium]|nr:hypothetical protein [Burkholderiaceae bacterium]